MRRTFLIATAFAIASASVALPAEAQRTSGDRFEWSGALAAGRTVRIYNLNGSVRVEAADGATASVVGEKRYRQGDPREVRFEMVRDGDNVTVCALWHEEATCDRSGARYPESRQRRSSNNDTSVQFTVRLPRGVNVVASSVNGAVEVRGATAEVVAKTVNGRVEATSSGGPVEASTVNGSLHARMAQLPRNSQLEYSTVNGSVTIEVPASLSARIEMSTVNGSLSSDFPMTLQGRVNPRRIDAVIGSGDGRLTLKTVNGSINLRKLD